MAKKFGGFTPQQQQTLLSKMGYDGPAQQDDINKFMMSSPKAASMMGKYAQMAKARVEGGPQMAMHVGGDVPLEIKPGQSLADAATAQQAAADQMADTQDPQIAAANTAQAEAIKQTVRPQPMVNPGLAQPQPVEGQPLPGTQGAMIPTTDSQSALLRAESQRFNDENRDVLMAASEAGKRLQQEAMLEAGLTQPPQNQEEADRLNSIMQTKIAASPEIKAAQDLQNAFNQQMQDRVKTFNQGMSQPLVQRPLAQPVQQPQMRVRQNPQTGSFEVVNAQGKVVKTNLDNQQQAMQYVMEQRPQPTGRPLQAMPRPQPYVNPGRAIPMDPRSTTVKPMRPEDAFNAANAAARDNQMRDIFGVRPEDFSMYAQPQYENRFGAQGFQEGGTVVDENSTYTTGQEVFEEDYTGANERAVEQPEVPAYDPSQGLPEPVDTLYTDPNEAIDAAFGTDFNAGTEGTNQRLGDDKAWAKSTVDTLANVENPKDYTLRQDGSYWTLVYPDGTEIKTGHKNKSYAAGRGNILAAAADATRNVVTEEQKTAAEQQYQQNVDIYNQYTTGAAQEKSQAPVAESIKASQDAVNVSTNLIGTYNKQLAALDADDPRRADYEKRIADEQVKLNQAKAELTTAQQQQSAEKKQGSIERTTEFEADPSGSVTKADVATVSEEARKSGMIDETVGQAGEVATTEAAQAAAAEQVDVPVAAEAATYTAEETEAKVQATLDKLTAATGKPSEDALAEAQTMDPEQLAQLGLTAAQIEEAVQVKAPAERTLQEGELIEGPTVDMERLEEEALNFEAVTGTPSTEATVQGQLTGLMEGFEGGETPAWAAGAMRAATQRMAARGLAASSMAGQAIVQAAMESAMPIAMADAATVARFEERNLSNRQEAAILKAEQRAKFLGMEFDQAFQTRVENAAKISDIANQNFTAEVQISLENARLANSVDLANLDAKNAKMLSDAAAMTQIETQNLNNRQQAAVQQANAFLEFDMSNLDREQQVAIFKSEGNIQSILSDAAATNAAAQFNATSENQTNQFYDSLISTVQQFNVDQKNAVEMFNTEAVNAMTQFNNDLKARREEFNATNALIIGQANAKWDQEITLTETAAINEANRDAALAANQASLAAYEAQKQAERDAMSYAFQTANNNADRATEIALQTMRNEAAATTSAASKSAALATAVGAVVAEIF